MIGDNGSTYQDFLQKKSQLDTFSGFEPLWMPDLLFDFQKSLVEWSIRKGRAAIFADCGLGKTPMQLVWAQNIVQRTNGKVLILTPLAVSEQTIREGRKFGIECFRSQCGKLRDGINVTNYERLHYFNANDFVGVVCDESSILKSFDGVTRAAVTEFMRKLPYRLLCTATAAPNDYIELGTSSEALGELGYTDMLNRFFKSETNTISVSAFRRAEIGLGGTVPKWRLKRHAEIPFWRWVSSWARALRRPSDLGFNDDGFILSPLIEHEHVVTAETLPSGLLFSLPAIGLHEQRDERRRTIPERCNRVAGIVSDTGQPALVWCHLNVEGERLAQIIPDSQEISGKDSDEAKEEKFLAFASRQIRVLVTKPKIGAWGLNFQHCAHVTFFPSHSYEQYYQGVRRCWRFGQTRPVVVDIITTEGEIGVKANLQRKSESADKMFSGLVAEMCQATAIDPRQAFPLTEELPSWL